MLHCLTITATVQFYNLCLTAWHSQLQSSSNPLIHLPLVLAEEFADEVLGIGRHILPDLIVKVVVHLVDEGERLAVRVSREWRVAAQSTEVVNNNN